MIIHSFLSDGLYNWAVLFLESFKYYNGTNYKIVLKSLGLNSYQMTGLCSIYDNIDILNEKYDWKRMSQSVDVKENRLKVMKGQVEHGSDKIGDNYKWKQLMSVEERYRKSLPEVISLYKDRYRYLFHLDIDMYFVRDIKRAEKIIRNSDITLEVRTKGRKSQRDTTKIAGGIMGFDMHSEHTHNMIESWCKFIDATSTEFKPREYGQTTLYYTYKHMPGDVKWGKFTREKEMSMYKSPDSIVWSGNRGRKKNNLVDFRNHFRSIKRK